MVSSSVLGFFPPFCYFAMTFVQRLEKLDAPCPSDTESKNKLENIFEIY